MRATFSDFVVSISLSTDASSTVRFSVASSDCVQVTRFVSMIMSACAVYRDGVATR